MPATQAYAASPGAAVAAPPMARPTGVTILAVLDYIGAGFAVLAGIFFLALAGMGGAFAESMGEDVDGLGVFFAGLGMFVAILLFGMAVLYFFLGRGLWRGQNWARVVNMVFVGIGVGFAAIGLLSSFALMASDPAGGAVSIVTQLISGGINGFILWYFLQPGVKRWFGA